MKLTKENTPEILHEHIEEVDKLFQIFTKVMDLKRRRDELSNLELIGAYIYVAYGYVRDVWFNITTAAAIFDDPAQELLFTARLKRYRSSRNLDRKMVAEYLCDEILDEVDPDGDHC